MSLSVENWEPRFGSREREFVFGVVMKLLRAHERAEDAAQDALLLAFRHRASYRGDAQFTTWLYRIAETTALMHLRKQRRGVALLVDDAAVECCEHVPAPGLDQEVARMRFAEGYGMSEIEEALGLSAPTVKSRVHRSRTSVRAALGR